MAEVAKPVSDFMGQGGKVLLVSRSWSFRELNELATRQHTQSAFYRRLLKMVAQVLPGGVDPGLYVGYSPSEASRWATLDDYIADFQAGFFENGAVPAGQFIIAAACSPIELKRRGDNCKDGTIRGLVATMSPTRTDQLTLRPSKPSTTAAVEWVPILTTEQRY